MSFSRKSWKPGCIVIALLMSVMIGISATAQAPEATPDDAVSRAFLFYPAGTRFGEYFEPVAAAGETVELTALLGNTGDEVQSLRIYALDAFTADGGGFGFADDGPANDDVTGWLDFPDEAFSIEPGQGVEVGFTLTIPEGTPPGQYITALAAEHADASEIPGSTMFNQKTRFVVPVFITVEGDVSPGFDIGDIRLEADEDRVTAEIDLRNTGDVRVRPQGEVSIMDAGGELVTTIPVDMRSIYARDETTLRRRVPALVESGTYDVTVSLRDPDTGIQADSTARDLAVEIAEPEEPAEASPIQIVDVTILASPSEEEIRQVSIDTVLNNTGDAITTAQMSLLVRRDDELVERFPVSQSLSLPRGTTEINTRYIPLDGFSSGTWTFELLIESVAPDGTATVLVSAPIDGELVLP